MKIGIDARILQGEMRGQGQYAYYLIKNLLEIDKKNEYILFYNGFKKGSFAFPAAIPNLRQVWCSLPGRMLNYSWSNYNFPLIEYLIGDLDIFHNPFNFNFTHYTPVPSKAKMIVSFNGAGDPSKMWENYDISRINRWHKIIEKRADMVIAISGNAKEDFLRKADIQENKVRVIYCGISENFRPIDDEAESEAILAKYGLFRKRYILYVGAAESNKNLSGLLKAFLDMRLRVNINDLCLVLAGKIDPAFQKIIQESEELGIKDKVIFTDFIPHSDLPFIYNGALIFVLPSFYEGFGIPIIEAMACGVPVAVSGCGGIPEVAKDAALFFDPMQISEISQALLRLVKDQQLRQDLRLKGLERAKDFTWQKTAEQTLRVYNEIYNNR